MNEKEKITPELNNETIESMIYIIRGQKVILDSDLAKIYGYETKYFNRQVKNNINKFSEKFMFQLSHDELNLILRCKNFTLNINGNKTGMHFKYLPYVFTEQGIYTLMTVLKGDNVSFITDTLVDYLKDDSNLNKWLNEANNCEIV